MMRPGCSRADGIDMSEDMEKNLVGIRGLAKKLGISFELLKKYEALGIIRPAKKEGKKELYDQEKVINVLYTLRSCLAKGYSVPKIACHIGLHYYGDYTQADDIKRILIADDDHDLVEIFAEGLINGYCGCGYVIYKAYDGSEAVKWARLIFPDLIILDLAMPVMDGLSSYEYLKRNPRMRSCKFILMSGSMIYEPEGDVFLLKPFELNEFVEAVKSLID